jgi:pimeloyl-ACP methyl ester carboxylesterase
MANPVFMVHGWGGSFKETWQSPGWEALLQDAGRTVVGIDLLGHGTSAKPHDEAAYSDLTTSITDKLGDLGPDNQIDAVGFSLGAITLLELACRRPELFSKLVLCGIGANVLQTERSNDDVLRALRGEGSDNVTAQLFVQYADQPGNDRVALTACMAALRPQITVERLAGVTCRTLVVIGDKDFAGPGEPLAEALPNAKLVTLRNVDHFATTESFGCIDAVLEFLDAVPS